MKQVITLAFNAYQGGKCIGKIFIDLPSGEINTAWKEGGELPIGAYTLYTTTSYFENNQKGITT